jgi:hypothetical protein
LRDRIGRLASALEMVGVRPRDSVGVLDWDSNRFLEAFFAIPMMGVVLQTVNVRRSPEQIAYTIDHAGSSTVLVNDEFVDLVQSILPQLPKVKRLVVLTDQKEPATGKLEFVGEYEQLLAAASPDFEFDDFDENVQATTFYTTGTRAQPLRVAIKRGPKGRPPFLLFNSIGCQPRAGGALPARVEAHGIDHLRRARRRLPGPTLPLSALVDCESGRAAFDETWT